MIKRIKRWNRWRKNSLNSKLYQLLVLFKIVESPTFGTGVLYDEDLLELVNNAFLQDFNEAMSKACGWSNDKRKEK